MMVDNIRRKPAVSVALLASVNSVNCMPGVVNYDGDSETVNVLARHTALK